MVTTQRRARQRGKRNQVMIAKLLDGDNRGIIGKEDVRVDNKYYIECKEREELPKFLTKMLGQAKYNCPENKVPVVQIHTLGSKYMDDLIIIPMYHFIELIKGGSLNGEDISTISTS